MRAYDGRKLLASLLMLAAATAAHAAVAFDDLDINVVLQADGSARFTEVWTVDHDGHSGTELFRRRRVSETQQISDFGVTENGREYDLVSSWDMYASDKEGLCGMIEKNDVVELCWGTGSAGRHTYTVSYTVTSLVRPYHNGHALLNYMFCDAGNMPPRNARVTISRADSAFTEADVIDLTVNAGNVRGEFNKGQFILTAPKPMAVDEYLAMCIEFPITAFGEMDDGAYDMGVTASELTSPMMTDSRAGTYKMSLWSRLCDFYVEWPVLTLLLAIAAVWLLFFVIKKIAIALA
ncbi:MAG: DUF2207 domain-containing protein [Muribaculaceae bacterium]|nr:DUF2207 domain-containing protein [Muribaculaceae bacterium]